MNTTSYDAQVDAIIGHLSIEEQNAITERAVIILGDALTDESYLATLAELVD